MELSKRVVRGSLWLFALRFVYQIFFLARLIILARLLEPRDFGLMGIALLTMMILDTFSQTGFYEALIQRKKNIEDYLDPAWTVLILRGFILAFCVYLLAPVVADFFNTPAAKPIVRVIGLAILIQGLSNIGVIFFSKELDFRRQFIYQTAGTVVGFITAVSCAVIFRNVWALVWGLIAGRTAQLILSYVIHPYRPRISTDFSKAAELFTYGKWILGSTVLVFVITQGDDILVGKILGAAMLGFYQIAYKISNTPTTEITKLISEATLPAYSKIQDEPDRLKSAYLRVLQITAFMTFPLTGFIFILAPDFTRLFLGVKWMPMVPALQTLVFAGLIRSIVATTGPLFYGIGKPRIDTKWQMVRFFVLAICIYPLIIRWELVGASAAVFISIFISGFGFVYYAAKEISCKLKEIALPLLIPFINTAAAVGSIALLKIYIWGNFLNFCLYFLAGSCVYIILTWLSDRLFHYKMISSLKLSIRLALNK